MKYKWKEFRLGDIAEINEMSITRDYEFTLIEYIDTSSVTENIFEYPQEIPLKDAPSRARRIVRQNDILLSTVRPTQKHFGYVQNCKPNTIASTGFAVITAKSFSSSFLYFWLTRDEITTYLNTVAESSSTTFPAFKPDLLNELIIRAPERVEDQNAVAQILLDQINKEKINDQINQNLKSIAQALFKSWFVDFDPVRAK